MGRIERELCGEGETGGMELGRIVDLLGSKEGGEEKDEGKPASIGNPRTSRTVSTGRGHGKKNDGVFTLRKKKTAALMGTSKETKGRGKKEMQTCRTFLRMKKGKVNNGEPKSEGLFGHVTFLRLYGGVGGTRWNRGGGTLTNAIANPCERLEQEGRKESLLTSHIRPKIEGTRGKDRY